MPNEIKKFADEGSLLAFLEGCKATFANISHKHDNIYDAKGSAAAAQAKADSAYTLAEGKVDSLSDLGITATATELNYVDGVKSKIQTQLDTLGSAIDGFIDWFGSGTSIPNGTDLDTYTTTGKYFMGSESGAQSLANCPTTTNFCMYVLVRTSGGSKTQMVIGLNGKMYIRSCNSSGVWRAWQNFTTEADLSTLQTSIENTLSTKANSSHTHAISDVTNLQSSLDAKQATITGGATTIASSNLTTSRALISNGSGKVAVSAVTSTELGYLDGVTSNVQTQLDSKAASSHTHTKSQITDFPASLKNPNALTIQGNGTTLTNGTYDGSAAKTVNITPSGIGAAASSHTHDDRYYTESEIDSKVSTLNTAIDGKAESSHTHNYAGSSSAGGSATKVKGTLTNPSSATFYAIPFHSSVSTGDKSLLNNNGLQYQVREGTASVNGYSVLTLGNSTASGTAGNKFGQIDIYAKTANRGRIMQSDISSDIYHYLPTKQGTLLNDKDFTVSNGVLTLNFL